MSQTMSPPYIFRIDEIREADDAPATIDIRSHWVPSVEAGANIPAGGGASGIWWYCNGNQIQRLDQAPSETLRYKTYSTYYSGGRGFWILEGSALSPADDATWQPLRFEHGSLDYSSYLTNVAQSHTLACQRANQGWPNMLLPNIYHGIETPYQQYGALKGELGIFLALVAFSMRKDLLPQCLPAMFAGKQWLTHTLKHGREDGRGVIVYVYACPAHWNDNRGTKEDLELYENGQYYGAKYYH